MKKAAASEKCLHVSNLGCTSVINARSLLPWQRDSQTLPRGFVSFFRAQLNFAYECFSSSRFVPNHWPFKQADFRIQFPARFKSATRSSFRSGASPRVLISAHTTLGESSLYCHEARECAVGLLAICVEACYLFARASLKQSEHTPLCVGHDKLRARNDGQRKRSGILSNLQKRESPPAPFAPFIVRSAPIFPWPCCNMASAISHGNTSQRVDPKEMW